MFLRKKVKILEVSQKIKARALVFLLYSRYNVNHRAALDLRAN